MEHRPLKEVSTMAGVHSDIPQRGTTAREQRLELWAAALDRQNGRSLRPLQRVEFLRPQERELLRADDSPLTVAFEDPRLRAAGLRSDRLGAVPVTALLPSVL